MKKLKLKSNQITDKKLKNNCSKKILVLKSVREKIQIYTLSIKKLHTVDIYGTSGIPSVWYLLLIYLTQVYMTK